MAKAAAITVTRRNRLFPPIAGKGGGYLIEARCHIVETPATVHSEDVDLKTITSIMALPVGSGLANTNVVGSIDSPGSINNYASFAIGSAAGEGSAVDLYLWLIGE